MLMHIFVYTYTWIGFEVGGLCSHLTQDKAAAYDEVERTEVYQAWQPHYFSGLRSPEPRISAKASFCRSMPRSPVVRTMIREYFEAPVDLFPVVPQAQAPQPYGPHTLNTGSHFDQLNSNCS